MTIALATCMVSATACDEAQSLDDDEASFRGSENDDLPVPAVDGAEAKAGNAFCGGACPSGQHVTQDFCSPACSGYSGFSGCAGNPTTSNAVTCAVDAGASFSSCELDCPTGYHVAADTCSPACNGYSGFSGCAGNATLSNAIICVADTGYSFSSCELGCPGDYHVAADTCSTACSGYSGFSGCAGNGTLSNAVTCVEDAGLGFTSCENTCPDEYAVTSNLCSPSCSGYLGFSGCAGTLNSNAIQCSFVGDCLWDPGDPHYCRDCGPCGPGEGQCSNHYQCDDGLGCYGGQCATGIPVGNITASPQVVGILDVLGETQIGAHVEFAPNPQIFVRVDGGPQSLFAGFGGLDPKNANISQPAPWIQLAMSYEFILYANGLGSTVLDTVTVTGQRVCAASEYPLGGSCYPRPILSLASDDGSACGDLGSAYPPPGYLVRTTVVGRPGATVEIYNQHASCGGNFGIATDSGPVIPPSGELVMDIPTGAGSSDCSFGGLFGHWRKIVVVDGVESNEVEFTFYNSQCAQIGDCEAAFDYCE
jgi:hypothetical protein